MWITRLRVMILLGLLTASVSTVHAAGKPCVSTIEVVTSDAATGDGGNAWGGHQCRIVRTRDGVFTAFTVPGQGPMNREWRLAHRRQGEWKIIAQGGSGREPVNLLSAPDGTLHVIAWPDGSAHVWSGTPKAGKLTMQKEAIPGLPTGNWPYGSAGIDHQGNLFVLASEGSKPGAFQLAFRDASSGKWTSQRTELAHRHCYSYVMPDRTGGLSVVSTRDVTWDALGYKQPTGAFAYAFNAFGFFRAASPSTESLARRASIAEEPTKEYPSAFCNAQNDAYLDTKGRLHILYRRNGHSTGGKEQRRQAVFSPTGSPVTDIEIPAEAGTYCRMIEDDLGHLYVLGSAGALYPTGENGIVCDKPWRLDLQEHEVEYSGFALAAPRTGTQPSRFVDAVFPSDRGRKWVYCRIVLREDDQGEAQPSPAGDVLKAAPEE